MTTTPAARAPSPPPLTRMVEWSFLRFVRQAYGASDAPGAAAGAPTMPLDLAKGLAGSGPDRPLLAWLSPVIVRGTVEWLARHGGYQRRDVVVNGRARTGRIWDEGIWNAKALSIGAPTVAWLAATWDAMRALDARTQGERADRRDAATPRKPGAQPEESAPSGVVTASEIAASTPSLEEIAGKAMAAAAAQALPPGDRVALTAAFWHLIASPVTTDAASLALAPHVARFPLFLLTHPRFTPLEGALAFPLAEDVEGSALQYLDGEIANALVAEVQRVRVRSTADERVAAFRRLARLLGALFASAPSGRGDHWLASVARFYPTLWRDLGGASGVNDYVARGEEVLRTTADREAYQRAFGDLLAFGPALDARVQEIVATPWPDRTEAQKRLVTEHETRYRSIRDEVRTLSRRLRREVG
ncbi:MAG TPA: hypothetical protein VMV18_04250 [bacterium]|nr:hypothetical protein [bacterium]